MKQIIVLMMSIFMITSLWFYFILILSIRFEILQLLHRWYDAPYGNRYRNAIFVAFVLSFFCFLLLFSYLPYAYLPVPKNKKNVLTVSFIVIMLSDFFKTIFHSLRLVGRLVWDGRTKKSLPDNRSISCILPKKRSSHTDCLFSPQVPG